jgi:uncharacterized protein (TIGR00251 family)
MNIDNLINLPFIKQQDNAILLSVYIQPNAKETVIVGLHNDRLKIKIAAPPTDGKANKILCNFIAKQFSVPSARVTILRGENTRMKLLKIEL